MEVLCVFFGVRTGLKILFVCISFMLQIVMGFRICLPSRHTLFFGFIYIRYLQLLVIMQKDVLLLVARYRRAVWWWNSQILPVEAWLIFWYKKTIIQKWADGTLWALYVSAEVKRLGHGFKHYLRPKPRLGMLACLRLRQGVKFAYTFLSKSLSRSFVMVLPVGQWA